MITHQTTSQSRAIAHGDGPAIVLAGPGSGKTLVITRRIAYLIREMQVPGEQILVITFSKAAAEEMRERFARISEGQRNLVTFGTFHAVFFRILRAAYHFTTDSIIREEAKRQLLIELAQKAGLEEGDPKELAEALAGEISTVKNERIALEHYYSGVCSDEKFREIFQGYREEMSARRLLDFDDMLLYTWQLLTAREDILHMWQSKYRYILVDEFQDINTLQYEVVRMLAAPQNNLFIVGDDDQSIYRFRGARPEIMLGFQKDYPDAQLICLEENFRCCGQITSLAAQVIGENVNRFKKQISCVRESGEQVDIRVMPSAAAQALYIVKQIRQSMEAGRSPAQIAVLTRTNTGGRFIAEKMMEFEIPFRTDDLLPNLYDHWIAGDILAYLRLSGRQMERRDFLRVMNRPVRYIARDMVDQSIVEFEELKEAYSDKQWMVRRLDEFADDLGLLGGLSPYAAINYIRSGMGYDTFLKEYAMERRIQPEELEEVIDELQERSRQFRTHEEWFAHIEIYRQQLEQRRYERRTEDKDKPRVTLSTLHASKGLEYEEVFLPDLNDGVVPYKKAVREADIEEERRLLYVGMTRAKDKLHLLCLKEYRGRAMEPSRFIRFDRTQEKVVRSQALRLPRHHS